MFLSLLFLLVVLAKTMAICDNDWAQFNGSCFKAFLTSNPIGFCEARRQCIDVGADLASIHSAEENQFVQSLVKATRGTTLKNATSFFFGLLLDQSMILTENEEFKFKNKVEAAFWTDGTPLDYGDSSSSGFFQGRYPWFKNGTSKIEIVSLPPELNRNGSFYANEICVFMLSNGDANGGSWVDLPCYSEQALGFVCKKDPNIPKEPIASSLSFTAPALSCFSILVQIYVLWLIVFKSPTELHDYRFFLCVNTIFDALFTFVLGILFNPNFWFPHALAGTVNGLGRFFGPYGGLISFCLSICACTCQVIFQSFALLYRFSSVMEAQFPRLYLLLNRGKMRVAMLIFVALYAPPFSLLAIYTLNDPHLLKASIYAGYDGHTLMAFSNAQLTGLPVFMLMPFRIHYDILIFGGGFLGVQFACLIMSIYLVLYLKRNAKYFVERRTYVLQMQLILSLIIQLCLPFLFVGIPLLGTFIAWLFFVIPGKNAVSTGFLLLELYALSNPLMVVLLIGAYRQHTAKLFGGEWLKGKFGNGTRVIHLTAQSPENGQTGQIVIEEQFPMGNMRPAADAFPTVAWMPREGE